MKIIKWKSLITTSVVCLLPILLGLALWDKLPDVMAIHFDINNNPDNFASKGFVVFGLPCLMVPLQIICCLINDINAAKHGDRVKFERVTKWIIPVLTIVLQTVTFLYGMGRNVDIRKVVALIVGVIFLVIGNYLPKFDYVKNKELDTHKARKINRFIGYHSVMLGMLSIVTMFLPPVSTVIWLLLLIPYAISSILYGIKVGKSQD